MPYTKLDSESELLILQLAKNAISNKLNNSSVKQSPKLNNDLKGGLFVTLTLNGQLRGCIGNFNFEQRLNVGIPKMALAAAFNDPRFAPVNNHEWPQIKLEISLLTPLKLISSLDEVEIGTHGLYLVHPEGQGVLLPQVAQENHWDKETFAKKTAQKAGLPNHYWQDPLTKLSTFTAHIIKE